MTREDLTTLRASACGLVGTLGAVLDSLQVLEQMLAVPGDDFSTTLLAAQHLQEAAAVADTLAAHASEFALAIDRLQQAADARAGALEIGGVA